MDCLILAAGRGSRLQTVSDSKPLTPVAGKPLLEHVVTAAAEAGCSRFTIATGYQAERVESFAVSLAARLGLTVQCVRNERWERPNGHSVLCGASSIEGGYLLLMADHLFDRDIVRRLRGDGPEAAGLTLAIDRRLDRPGLDLDDATKVRTGTRGEIVRIGKQLAEFDAVDTGIFLAGPELEKALREVIGAGGSGSLSEGVQRLADGGRAMTVDVSGCRWLDVDDPRALALAQDFAGSGAGVRDNAV